jgi:CheY-like chemotaxis protein
VSRRSLTKLPPILLVEDDENDVFLMRVACTAAHLENPMFVAQDGQHATEFLRRIQKPALLITDIKMPRVDGFELLIWLQTQPQFHDLPKLVISSSVLEEDLAKSLLLGATAYFTKPDGLGALVHLVKRWKKDYLEKVPCS